MTSDVRQSRREEIDPVVLDEHATCLCCSHFAIDLDAVPEPGDKRRARLPKRKPLHAVEAV
jgi:hypothetical protein